MLNKDNPMYKIRIQDLPIENRPREKLKLHGPQSLANYELIAILFSRGTKKDDVISIAKRTIGEYDSVARSRMLTQETNVTQIRTLFNLSEVHACQLIACFELARRFFGRARKEIFLRTPQNVFEYLTDMRRLEKEHLRGLYLDVKNKLIRDEIISVGTLDRNLVHPREVLSPAIQYTAAGFILAHNHPSGDANPSREDIEITKQIAEVSKIIEIELLDHLIIGDEKYVSLKDMGCF